MDKGAKINRGFGRHRGGTILPLEATTNTVILQDSKYYPHRWHLHMFNVSDLSSLN